MNLNPARLALFTDWVTTLPPRPLPRTAIPVPGEYHLDYIDRLARANHLEFGELTGIVNDTAAITLHRGHREWEQHQQQRLATLASQPLPRITGLWWPDPAWFMRDPQAFRQALRPACRRCTARRGITGPVACHLPPHQTLCRRHRLWTGPCARSHDGQLDVSPFPEILCAQRRHLALVHHHPWQLAETAIGAATTAIYRALRAGTWIPGQQQRMRQLAPGTWHQAITPHSAPAPARQATAPATPSSRSRSIQTSSGSPRGASAHATRPHPVTPDHDEIAHNY